MESPIYIIAHVHVSLVRFLYYVITWMAIFCFLLEKKQIE